MRIQPTHRSRISRLALCLLVVLPTTGCRNLAPTLIRRDRSAIASAISDSWKDLTLMNIVKMRYGDIPVFLDVSSVISSNSIETSQDLRASAAPFLADDTSGLGQFLRGLGYQAGGSRKYTDRPTISYTPLTGEKMARNLMRPIQPSAIFSLVQAGYPVDFVLQLSVRAINGVYNRSSAPGGARKADPAFYELLDGLRRLQTSESIGMRLERRGNEEIAVMYFAAEVPDHAVADYRRVHEILGLAPDTTESVLSFGSIPRNDTELAVLSRSLMEIIVEMAAEIEVPTEHLDEGRAFPAAKPPANPVPRDAPLLRIRSGRPFPPRDAHVSVLYRNHVYWIDDRDFQSKRTFAFLLVLFPLAESDTTPQIPVITVPVG